MPVSAAPPQPGAGSMPSDGQGKPAL